MDQQGFEAFLTYSIGLCGVFAILAPMIAWRKRGRQSLVISGAFVAMAAVLFALRSGWPNLAVGALAVVLVVLLGADVLTRPR